MDLEKQRQMAAFIAERNNRDEHHVGYCGTNEEEILQTLQSEFSDIGLEECFSIVEQDGNIKALLGCDIDVLEKTAELWGPFVADTSGNEQMALDVWKELTGKIGNRISTYYGFYNIQNENGNRLMKAIGAVRRNDRQLIMEVEGTGSTVSRSAVVPYQQSHQQAFHLLHSSTFPVTYYNSSAILEKLDDSHMLYVYVYNGLVAGYIYFVAHEADGTGSIEYLGVDPVFRKRGIGTSLLQKAREMLCEEKRVEKLSICVSEKNKGAVAVYRKAGFEIKHTLYSYKKAAVE
ncbi:GNAT family N-acetyltransferase [Bacillus sp. 1P06AnD]|uniref:GNAT family N-acetyltransferase n=1 Tax=Bacillus sp. 1P06AnD TaxID=3132208 RepID=UPI0039A1500B